MNCVSTEKTCNNCGSVIGYKLIHKDVRTKNLAGETYELFHIYFHWCDSCKVDCCSYSQEKLCDGEIERNSDGIYTCKKCGEFYILRFVVVEKIERIVNFFSVG